MRQMSSNKSLVILGQKDALRIPLGNLIHQLDCSEHLSALSPAFLAAADHVVHSDTLGLLRTLWRGALVATQKRESSPTNGHGEVGGLADDARDEKSTGIYELRCRSLPIRTTTWTDGFFNVHCFWTLRAKAALAPEHLSDIMAERMPDIMGTQC